MHEQLRATLPLAFLCWLIGTVAGCAACGKLEQNAQIEDLAPGEVRKLCRQISGNHSCSMDDGFVAEYNHEFGTCPGDMRDYESCDLTVGNVRTCVNAIEACRSASQIEDVCNNFFSCQMSRQM